MDFIALRLKKMFCKTKSQEDILIFSMLFSFIKSESKTRLYKICLFRALLLQTGRKAQHDKNK